MVLDGSDRRRMEEFGKKHLLLLGSMDRHGQSYHHEDDDGAHGEDDDNHHVITILIMIMIMFFRFRELLLPCGEQPRPPASHCRRQWKTSTRAGGDHHGDDEDDEDHHHHHLPHDYHLYDQVTSPLVSQLRDQYSLAWTVQSFLRIEEARILYRRLMVFLPEFELFSCNIFFAQKDGTNSDWTNIIPTLNDGHAMTSVSGAR